MAGINFPSIQELSQMEFLPPMLFNQAQDQIGLANQFNQQALQTGAEDLRAKALANMFSEQNNPLRLEEQRLRNEGTGFENVIKQIESEQRKALAPEELQAKREKLLMEMDDARLKRFFQQAEREMQSDDPRVQQSGQRKIMASRKEWERREAHRLEMEKLDKEIQGRKEVANIGAAATRYSADARERAVNARRGPMTDLRNALISGKVPPANAAIAAYSEAQRTEDPLEREEWMELARAAETFEMNRRRATQEGKIDAGAATKMPTIQLPSALPTSPSRPSAPRAPARVEKLPEGSRQIGTHKGKPVYQTPDGKKFIGE